MIKKLEALENGRFVGYTNKTFELLPSSLDLEIGIITSYNDRFIFVKFGESETSQACNKEHLYTINSCYEQGYDARIDNLSSNDNPFDSNTQSHKDWEDGYNMAKDDYKDYLYSINPFGDI